MRRGLLIAALVVLVITDLMLLPFAGLMVFVGGFTTFLGTHGHHGDGLLRGGIVLIVGSALGATALVWLTVRTVRSLQRA